MSPDSGLSSGCSETKGLFVSMIEGIESWKTEVLGGFYVLMQWVPNLWS